MSEHNDILQFATEKACESIHMVIDVKTQLKGVVVIHNTTLGPALGGCRFIEYASTLQATTDAIRLAEGMTYKAAISGLSLGGGKTVLLKPKEPIDRVQYFKAFGRFLEQLGGRYITAVDVGTTVEDMDIIETETHYVTSTTHKVYSLPDPSSMTALGIVRGMKAAVLYKLGKNSMKGVHVAVQGLGHVGMNVVKLLLEEDTIVTVTDVKSELVEKCVEIYGKKIVALKDPKTILTLSCDVFCPCALGQVLNQQTIPYLKTPIVAGAANNQLEEPEDGILLHKRGILYAPDFAINAGGLIYVAGQHSGHTEAETRAKIMDLHQVLLDLFKRAESDNTATSEVAYKIARERIQRAEKNSRL